MMYAKYTCTLKTLLDCKPSHDIIVDARSKYPLYERKSKNEFIPNFNPTREELNKALLNRYKYHEIAFETPGRFVDELEIAMAEIMPYYNQLLFTMDQDFNIIFNVDYQKTLDTLRNTEDNGNVNLTSNSNETSSTNSNSTSESETSVESNANSTNKSKHVESETPQGQLNLSNNDIDAISYADKASWGKDDNNATTSATGSTQAQTNTTNEAITSNNVEGLTTTTNSQEQTEKTIETTKGNFGVVSAQDLILKYRETIINITQDIINDKRIRDLFLYIY